MAGKHGGSRPGAGRKSKTWANQNVPAWLPRQQQQIELLEQQARRATARGRLEIAERLQKQRLELLSQEIR